MSFKDNECGSILILFAATLILLTVFLALSTDIALAFNKKDKLTEVGNLIRDARFDIGEELWNSNNPEFLLKEVAVDIAKKNGLKSNQVDVEWNITKNSSTHRMVNVKIIITDVYECTTLKMLGINELPIKVVIDGYQEKKGTMVWRPGW